MEHEFSPSIVPAPDDHLSDLEKYAVAFAKLNEAAENASSAARKFAEAYRGINLDDC